MLANPVMDEAINIDAAQLYEKSPSVYRQMVLDCVLASVRVDGR